MLGELAAYECNDLFDSFVQVEGSLAGRRLLDLSSNLADDVTCSVSIAQYGLEGFFHLHQVGRIAGQKAQRCMCVVAGSTNRVVDLVRNRSGELPHRRHTVRACKLCLKLTQSFCSAFALRQIENEGNTLVPIFLEGCRADQYRYTTAVLAEELLFDRLQTAGHSELWHEPQLVTVLPVVRSQLGPANASCDQVFPVKSHHSQEGIVRLEN